MGPQIVQNEVNYNELNTDNCTSDGIDNDSIGKSIKNLLTIANLIRFKKPNLVKSRKSN